VNRRPPTDAPTSGFRTDAKKHLGQNFLHERGVIDRIVRAIAPQPGDALVEIGPGQGALTFPLLDLHGALTAIEFDRDLHAPLQAAARAHGKLRLIEGDVLGVDFTALAAELGAPGGRIRLIGNLPYNLSSPILFHALAHAGAIADMHFMLQKEVVERMAAAHGNKVYGRLTVMLQAFATVTPLFAVPPGAFRPAPKVDSAVVRLLPLPASQVGIHDPALFAHVVRAAFGQRRKTLRNALKGLADAAVIEAVGIPAAARAEQVPVAGFVQLANRLAAG